MPNNYNNMFTVGLTCYIILIISSRCMSVYKTQGQNVTLHFPYPCNTTYVTLQQSNRRPFYTSTFGPDLILLHFDQVKRFTVYNGNNSDSCFVDLMISNLMKDDQGTYILFVYKDGDIQRDDTHRIYLKVDYPPGKASCVVGDEMGDDWISLDCQANAGSLPGKIECYQNGVWMPTLTGPTETGSLLKQTILITQSGPVFCCSSLIDEVRERCECKDTRHCLPDGDCQDPCRSPSPTFPESTTMLIPSTFTKNNQRDHCLVSQSTPIKMEEGNDNVRLIFLSSLGLASVLLYSFFVCVYKCSPTRKSNSNSTYDPPRAHKTVSLFDENERKCGSYKGKN